jgi:hypothetical protein
MKINLVCLLALACPVLSVFGANAAAEEDRVSAVIVLQDADVASLKQTGYLKMAIPPALINRVDSVTLKRPVRFKDEAAILFNDVDRRSGMVSVRVDDATMEQIDYQPVELKIYESGFSSIVVEYLPGNSTPPKKASKDDSAVFVTNLANSKSLTGRLADMKEFMIKSELGEIDVVLDEVSQIKFEEDERATIQMENGDKVSGKIDFRNITINSRWGLEDLKVSDIVSISKPISNSMVAPSVNAVTEHMPMSVPHISIPQPIMEMPNYSQFQNYPNPTDQRIDVVPEPVDQPTGPGYQSYTDQQAFDQAVDQLMLPMEMMPVDQQFGPFFEEPMPINEQAIGEQPIGGYGEIIQNAPEIPSGQPTTPDTGDDFWFFPQ